MFVLHVLLIIKTFPPPNHQPWPATKANYPTHSSVHLSIHIIIQMLFDDRASHCQKTINNFFLAAGIILRLIDDWLTPTSTHRHLLTFTTPPLKPRGQVCGPKRKKKAVAYHEVSTTQLSFCCPPSACKR